MIKVCFSVEAGKHMQTSLANMWPLWILLLQGEATRPTPAARQKNQKKQFGKTERTGYLPIDKLSSCPARGLTHGAISVPTSILQCAIAAAFILTYSHLIAFCPKSRLARCFPKTSYENQYVTWFHTKVSKQNYTASVWIFHVTVAPPHPFPLPKLFGTML